MDAVYTRATRREPFVYYVRPTVCTHMCIFLVSTQNDRAEDAALESGIRLKEECSLNRSRWLKTDVGCLKTKRQPLRIGTWNVRTLYATAKLDNAMKEAKEMRIDILGLSEFRRTCSEKIKKEEHTIIYSGGDNHTR